MSSDERLPPPQPLIALADGEIDIEGRMPWSSNGTFLVTVRHEGTAMHAIYKPLRGERPLYDFPDGLYTREVAAYELSEALGWGLVPETVLREHGPLGIGSLQRFVDADFEQHYFTLVEREELHGVFRQMAAFDMIANNTDRKSGHCLIGEGRIWGIDNGLCFHVRPKLRTVIWDFGGEPVPAEIRQAAGRLAHDPPPSLGRLLHDDEVEAVAGRAALVARMKTFPNPDPDSRPYPWPLV